MSRVETCWFLHRRASVLVRERPCLKQAPVDEAVVHLLINLWRWNA